MSAKNGDKSRFHRERKQNIARRQRNRELLKRLSIQPKSEDSRTKTMPKAVGA